MSIITGMFITTKPKAFSEVFRKALLRVWNFSSSLITRSIACGKRILEVLDEQPDISDTSAGSDAEGFF